MSLVEIGKTILELGTLPVLLVALTVLYYQNGKIKSIKETVGGNSDNIETLLEDVAAIDERLNTLDDSSDNIETLLEDVAAIDERLNTLDDNIENLRDRLDSVDNNSDISRKVRDAVGGKISEDIEEQFGDLDTDDLGDIRDDIMDDLGDIRDDLDSLEEESQNIGRKVDKLDNKVEGLDDRVMRLEQRVDDLYR